MKFKLEIDLGNVNMCTSADLADALRSVAKCVEHYGYVEYVKGDIVGELITRGIQDENGNTCGSWSVWDELTSMEKPK